MGRNGNIIGLRSLVDSENQGNDGDGLRSFSEGISSNGVGLCSFYDSESSSIAPTQTLPANRAGKSAHLDRLRLRGGEIW